MFRRAHKPLVALNAILLALLVAVWLSPRAGAQNATRARGTYTMVSGRVQGVTTSGIYLLDSSNQELVALIWDRTHDRLNVIGHRSITSDARQQRGAR